MRHFLTIDASRSYTAGGFSFPQFEPVGLRGGSWLGVLAVADDAAASALADSIAKGETIGVDEITEEYFNTLKKKGSATLTASVGSPTNLFRSPQESAASAENPGRPRDHNSTAGITAVTLLTGEANPPHEPLLEEAARKRRGQ